MHRIHGSVRFIIFCDTPGVKYFTCSRMYSKNESLSHFPICCMIVFKNPDRNILMDTPDLWEFMLMSESLKPNFSSPITNNVTLRFSSNFAKLIYLLFPCPYWYANIFVSSEVPLIYINIFTTFSPDFTGRRSPSSVLNMCTFLSLYALFCESYVVLIIVGNCIMSSFALCGVIFLYFLDFIFLNIKLFILLISSGYLAIK